MALGDKLPVLMGSQLGAPNGPAALNADALLPILQGGVEANNSQLALANLGALVQPSILDNGDFRANHIVNQRGVTTLSSGGKFNDRWSLYASGTVTIVSDGIQMQNVVDFGTQLELYRVEPGKPYTFSVFTSDGNCGWETIIFQNSVGDQHVVSLGDTGITLNAIYNWGGGTILIAFQGTQTISVTKGELGESQTLAYQDSAGVWKLLPQPNMDYGKQLRKCQQYLLMGPMEAHNLTAGTAFLPTPVKMRGVPIIVGTPSAYTVDSNVILQDVSISVVGTDMSNGVPLFYSPNDQQCYVFFPEGSGLSCEL